MPAVVGLGSNPSGLGSNPGCFLVDVKQVVGSSVGGGHDDHAHHGTYGCEEIEVALVLHRPAGVRELAVDEHAGALLRRKEVRNVRCGHGAHVYRW